jgi:serine/threonine protein kinase
MTTNVTDILFEKFEIVEVLKKNEHAAVYIAHHNYLGKKIVLKVLNTKTIGDDSIVERFKREAKTLAQLEHKNIIRVLDFGTYKEFFYISFEYFKSENLRSFINSNKISDEEKEKLVIQFMRGLSYAHKNKIIHRDIKPENILVNENLELKLSDFGLALSATEAFVTKQYSIVGTPSYMSPEQIKGEKLTLQSDLFSAGIVIYELYKGTNPFLGSCVNDSINNITNLNEKDFQSKLDGMPAQIVEAIEKLIVRTPSQRFESADEVLKLFTDSVEEAAFPIIPPKNKNMKILTASFFIIVLSIILIFAVNFEKESDVVESTNESEAIENKSNPQDNSELKEQINEPDKLTDEANEIKNTANIDKAIPQNVNPKAAEKVYGHLFVECIPWADVFIDGEKLETTPLKKNINLEDGSYKIKLVHPDFPVYENSILVEKDRLTTVRVNLDTLFGFIDFNVLPWGSVYLNEKYIGDTPFLNPLNVLPGEYKLKISNPNLGMVEDEIIIARNDTIKYLHRFN